MANRLNGKVALITGGIGGIGTGVSRLFVSEGARVMRTDLSEPTEIIENTSFHKHDVTDEESWKEVVAATLKAFGRIDILVNNAGILRFTALVDMPQSDFAKVLTVNVVGTFLGIKTVAPTMERQGGGSVVNMCSVAGMRGTQGAGAYSASKYAVRGLTRTACIELGHKGIRVNCVVPGGLNTAMTNPGGKSQAEVDERYADIPLQRAGRVEEIARACLFLASDEGAYCCGTELVADGGGLAGPFRPYLPGGPQPRS